MDKLQVNGKQGFDFNGRLKLQLRRNPNSVTQEARSLYADAGFEAITQSFMEMRQQTLEAMYNQTLAWIQVKSDEDKYLEYYGVRNIDELFSKFNLSLSKTLAKRECMVRLVDKPTFLIIGDQLLDEMISAVSFYQSDTAIKHKDFEQILTTYTKSHKYFNSEDFRKVLRWYIDKNYEYPIVDDATPVKGKTVPRLPKGMTHRKVVNVSEVNSEDVDLGIETYLCAGCKARNEHIAALERQLRENQVKPIKRPKF